MLHPSQQAVDFIWERLAELYLSPAAKQFVKDWKPIKAALGHQPFDPESEDYLQFLAQAKARLEALQDAPRLLRVPAWHELHPYYGPQERRGGQRAFLRSPEEMVRGSEADVEESVAGGKAPQTLLI